ncbi:hypothetical protein CAPTEDRAFT_198081 [Capitella teleta]|uniref:DUF4371 domain-containing protein n=1 Tax=Capitella teleta TaxID=283909 RepID=X1ZY99_CAPTE|nr:hypothetical protein CAPTEDRAFT_198081 [Capitella teleta]|eukprot:ELU04632.1 hypothetical protein CAPTEDRAFT_198081 [Capitella teleta]
MASPPKKSLRKVSLKTFESYGLDAQFGRTVANGNFIQVWCKLCAKYSMRIRAQLRGKALTDAEKFVQGSTNTVKNQVVNQPRIDKALDVTTRDCYTRLFRTAYKVAQSGMPLEHFPTLVDIQQQNGVQLLDGVQSPGRAREFIVIMASKLILKYLDEASFFSILSDGSQARKTGSEKELVLVRLVRDGEVLHLVVALQNVDAYGDANAENVKAAIDDAFLKKLGMTADNYKNSCVGATADGVYVNFGRNTGVLTRMKEERPWLLAVHCASHRFELAMKESIHAQTDFKAMCDLMIGIYYHMKRSGKTHIYRQLKDTASSLNMKAYKHPKTHGTRFINHTRNGLSALLKNWIPLIITLENAIAVSKKTESGKLEGYRRKLAASKFLEVKVVMALGPSNSIVESAFSILNAMLSDRRLSLQHSTMENLLLLKHNGQFIFEAEVEDIISSNVTEFLQKRRKRKLHQADAEMPGSKKPCTVTEEPEVKVVMALGPSNSIVESAFSILNAMLSDRRLSLQHSTMENLLLLKHNGQFIFEAEVEDIISSNVTEFLQKRRKRKLHQADAEMPGSKKPCTVTEEPEVIEAEEFYPMSDDGGDSDYNSNDDDDPFN